MRILIVDDEPMFLDLLEGSLAERGFADVVRATSAAQALKLVDNAEEAAFDCFLLDIQMPGTDGIELCAKIRARAGCRRAPIIMLTSSDAKKTMQAAFDAGATDFLNKPLNAAEVEARIRMAFMLVDVIDSETLTFDALEALVSLETSFDEFELSSRITFSNVKSMRDYFELENKLLKMGPGNFAMSLFSIRIRDFETLTAGLARTEIMGLIHMVANIISRTTPNRGLHFAYVGYGKFICVVIVRSPVVTQLLQLRVRDKLAKCLCNYDNQQMRKATLDVKSLSNRRIMDIAGALKLFRNEIRKLGSSSDQILPAIDGEASRLFKAMQGNKKSALDPESTR
ncbi:Response regulator receiver domain-containing protein [Roseovarius lutimaris]|uniref:Response regulator receiver domain-containing protein n=1 Tax=Roseovarius lutimaris TaxID=1005928 RepID=A0A1I5GCR4_9RHOB|nr:response regulator [Roseovarius lutimaris]SFO33772.1 Response regulator receiver domain-containing protein [Roseovarius lutimaris]